MTRQRMRTISHSISPSLFAIFLLMTSGCGDDSGLAQRYPVSGEVKFNGEPVANGLINFIPESAESRPASGQIEAGSFSLTTLVPNDGALPGKYKVTVISKSFDDTELKAIAKGGQFHHDKAFAKATKQAKNLIPSKYSLPTTTTLVADVDPKSNNFNFDLKD